MHTKRTLIVLASVILLAIVSIRCLPFAFDDAYIHFRIAKNLAADGLPFFNTGESVMATSSPVWTIVLGILALLPVRLAVIVALINSLFTVLGALVWSHVLQQIAAKELSRALRWGFSVAYIGVLLPSSVGLMETPLAMLLFGWGALLLIQSKPVAWTVLAFAAFTRYELVTFAVLAGAVQLTITRKNAVRGALLFAVPAAILSLLLVICFSSPIPQTVVAKQIVYSLSRSQVLD